MRTRSSKASALAVVIVSSLLIASCAGHQATISREEVMQYRASQMKWLSSLQRGLSPEDALRSVLPYQQYFFQYGEGGVLFQYMQGQYPATGTLFGLFFEDGLLTSLLLDQAVTDLGNCRISLLRQQEAWPLRGFQETASWIRMQNRLGDKYDDTIAVSAQNPENSEALSADEMVEIITHIPLVVIALPFYGLYKIAGGSDEALRKGGDPEQMRQRAIQVELGVSTATELTELLGAPDSKRGEKQRETWAYPSPEISFGIADGTVSWSESLYWGVPLNSATNRRDELCVAPD